MATYGETRNEDWIKTLSWGLGPWNEFLAHLGVLTGDAGQQKAAIAEFMHLPAAERMPDDIRERYEAL